MRFWNIAVTILLATLLAACSQPVLQSGPDAEMTDDGLVRVDNSNLAKTFVRPGMNLQNYSAIKLVSVGTNYRNVKASPNERYARSGRDEYPITDSQRESFEALVDEVFSEEFAGSKYFTLTEKPGSDVLVVKGGLIDVVSFVPPQRAARSWVYLAELGQATLILEVADSMSGESLARAADRRRVESNRGTVQESNPVLNKQEVKRVIRRWAKLLVSGLDELHQGGEVLQPE
jgi:hypothetical protein